MPARRCCRRASLVETVKLDKLTKQLRRDIAANPKKAAALGLMVLVALYFWGPLVWSWFAPAAARESSKASNVALILTDDPAEPARQGQGPRGRASSAGRKSGS